MSDSSNNPPPDDWAKTRPNIKLPDSDDSGGGDWDKTNYNYPKQPAADEWGKTVMNIKPINTSGQDYGKTIFPGAAKQPDGDWAATRANVNISDTDFGDSPAEPAVCTMLCSRMVASRPPIFANRRNSVSEMTATGIDALTVRPTFKTR